MFLHSVGAGDSRFKTLVFHEGMNILLADKTDTSTVRDSRNGAGKSSFVQILRYLLGGSRDGSLKSAELEQYTFWADLGLDYAVSELTRVERPIKPQTTVQIDGAVASVNEWKLDVAKCFGLPERVSRPTVGQLVGQLVRNYFQDALSIRSGEAVWECGARIGYFLGFSPEILSKAGEVAALKKHRESLNRAIKAGAVPALSLSEAELRAKVAQARQRRTQLEDNLKGFRIDDQYTDHQREADKLSAAIRDLNDEALVLEERRRDLKLATKEEKLSTTQAEVTSQLRAMYEEVGLVLPDTVARRFDEVTDFHSSVIQNRQRFLHSELVAITGRLEAVEAERVKLDQQRAQVMRILQESMALETFRSAERELAELDALVTDLEHRLELALSVSDAGVRLRSMKIEVEASVRTEIAELTNPLDEAIALFTQLGQEIYTDRDVSLLVAATNEGVFKVIPKIDGDASTGIQEVKTFLLDIVCMVMALKVGRAPRILVHDSILFDSMDDRQMASCLNIGARLADEHNFQYIVTLNSDRLAAAEAEAFERRDYVVQPVLTDAGDDGGLFGFQFK